MEIVLNMATFIHEVDFGAPSALLTDTVGSDPTNSLNAWTIRNNNAIQEIRHIVEPASTIVYGLYVRRLDGSKRLIGSTPDFAQAKIAQSQMPFPIGVGYFQWVEQQIAGALTAQKYTIKYVAPLAT
jgi:hypothetical protein